MELVIMRHAPTAGNRAHRYIGSTDEPLDDRGRQVAVAAGLCTEAATVYVSPLLRARQTASICFPCAEQRVVDGLREMNFGMFEGYSYDELRNVDAYRVWLDNSQARCPGGESQGQFVRRVDAAMVKIVAQARAEGASRVFVVAHGGTIMATMSQHAVPVRSYFDWAVGHCAGYRAVVEGSGMGYSLSGVCLFRDVATLCLSEVSE